MSLSGKEEVGGGDDLINTETAGLKKRHKTALS